MKNKIVFTIVFLFINGVLSCAHQKKCPPMQPSKIVKDIETSSTDSVLNIYITPNYLLIKGAKVGKIQKGKLIDNDNSEYYKPLMEAIYNEFSQRSTTPYSSIIIYAHETIDPNLIKYINKTTLRTAMAPVTLMPINFKQKSCKYENPTKTVKQSQYKISGTILIRQEKSGIYIDGKKIIPINQNTINSTYFDKNKMILLPLEKTLRTLINKHPKLIPVLHITYDANTKFTKFILLTAGKVGIFKLKTVRVLP